MRGAARPLTLTDMHEALRTTGGLQPAQAAPPRRSAPTGAAGVLMAAAGLTLVVASIVHWGLSIPLGFTTFRDPFFGAAIPEAVLGVASLLGAYAVLDRWSQAYSLALGAVGLSLLGTCYGISITVGSIRVGDIGYHLGLLAMLLAAAILLLLRGVRRELRAPAARRLH